MEKLIKGFSEQLKKALEIGKAVKLTESQTTFKNVLISGMGGSGIGGSIVAELTSPISQIPIAVNKNYSLPEYVGEDSLVIISSYSGNTEETIETLNKAIGKNSKIVCIASGGKILEIAKERNIDQIIIPEGMPPRSAIGYSIVATLFILNFYKIIDSSFKEDLEKSITLLDAEEENIQTEAKKIAEQILNRIPIIYSSPNGEALALRFQQELNENAKILAWHSVIPEMNHNELLGWRDQYPTLIGIFFRNTEEYFRTNRRIEITKNIIEQKSGGIIEIHTKGNSPIEKAMYQIHIGSWISFYLAGLRGVDPEEIKTIETLKAELSKLS